MIFSYFNQNRFIINTGFSFIAVAGFIIVLAALFPSEENRVKMDAPPIDDMDSSAHIPAPNLPQDASKTKMEDKGGDDSQENKENTPFVPSYLQERFTVKSGQTLAQILGKINISSQEIHHVVIAINKVFNLKYLKAGQDIHIAYYPSGFPNNTQENIHNIAASQKIFSLEIELSTLEKIMVTRKDDGKFHAENYTIPTRKIKHFVKGKINTSLYEAAVDEGLPLPILIKLIQIYSFDIDFQRDIQKGDDFQVIFEELQTLDGDNAGYADILMSNLVVGKRPHKLFLFNDVDGDDGDYYDENGKSVRKALMKTPIDGARLSSGFGYRKHPILGYNKLHKGVDFAAPKGTPVYAAGNGRVEYSGRNGGFGLYIRIRHNSTYKTAYAHLSRIHKRARNGNRVKQGDIIGYVGSTGRSTGPHLHYEIMKNDKQVNPRTLKLPSGTHLEGQKLQEFKRQYEGYIALLNDLSAK
jgi:murein DD-endopeptidase MepM/ murein hydrolase activator NlpD